MFTLIAACGMALLAATLPAACAPEKSGDVPVVQREGFQVPATGPLVLLIDDSGTFTELSAQNAPVATTGAGSSQPRSSQQPFPVAVSPAAIQPLGDGAIMAINRLGLRSLKVVRYADSQAAGSQSAGNQSTRDDVRLVIENLSGAEPEFAGRTVALSWGHGGEALFLLHRHPIFETEEPRIPATLIVVAGFDAARVMEGGVGADAFALYPVSSDAWMVQSRTEQAEKVITGYSRYATDTRSSVAMDRKTFEKAVSPAPVAIAAEEIKVAAAMLEGQLLIEARLPDGTRKTYVRGDPGAAAPVWAYIPGGAAYGLAALAVADDWRVVVVRRVNGSLIASTLFPAAPVQGAKVRDAAIVGGLLVMLWEEDLFPDIGASGMLVLDPGL